MFLQGKHIARPHVHHAKARQDQGKFLRINFLVDRAMPALTGKAPLSELLGNRREMWQGGIVTFKHNPVVGTGIGTYMIKMPTYKAEIGQVLNDNAGSMYLQLAAEQGGGVGVLLRPSTGPGSLNYAAATRWLVAPARGDRTLQRWKIQLVHGHGGRVGEAVCLEMCRRTGRIDARPARAMEKQAERPAIERVSA